jgi:CubicO group peptidase (beta-lactamase class C family)
MRAFLCYLYLLAIPIGVAFNAAASPAIDTVALDRFIAAQMQSQRIPGMALVITQHDRVIYLRGYGTARDGHPVTPQTQSFIASLSKSFTALAVMQLVEAARIDLDAPAQTYLPDFTLADERAAARITVRHLLNQTSGLSDLGFPEARPAQAASIAEYVRTLRAARPAAAPGVEFHYFDPNYAVLARIVEVVSGEAFSDYLNAHIFAPLGMSRSFSAVSSDAAMKKAATLAQGHLSAFGFAFACNEMSGYLGGSGGVISTAEDLGHYLIMQNDGGRFENQSLLSPAGLELMHTPPPGVDSSYAMGWFARTENGARIIEHNGVLSAFYADAFLLPESGYGVALLYNINSLPLDVLAFPRIKNGVIALLGGRRPEGGGFDVRLFGALVALVTLVTVALALRSLLRLPRWRQQTRASRLLRLLPGLAWKFVPALLLLTLPRLLPLFSDRVFGAAMLARAMPDLTVWLAGCAALGAINGIARLLLLLKRINDRGGGRSLSWTKQFP